MLSIKPVLVFDVNETLLNLSALDPLFGLMFNLSSDTAASELRMKWFSQVLQVAMVGTITDDFVTLSQSSEAALQMIAQQRDTILSEENRNSLSKMMQQLPLHPDVRPALIKLKAAGFRLVALTNNSEDTLRTQLENSGIDEFFEELMSAESAHRLKPAPEAYQMVASRLKIPMEGMMMVAVHAWDICGSHTAGAHTTFVARRQEIPYPHIAPPTIIATSLIDAANKIMDKFC